MKYFVKTRNWNGKYNIRKLLERTPARIGIRGYVDDNDINVWYETNNLVPALLVWLYWMLLRHWSGGWTYIVNNNKSEPLTGYKSFYL